MEKDAVEMMLEGKTNWFLPFNMLPSEANKAVFQRIGEDYVRNMHSYPENQPKQEDDTQQAFHIGKSEEKGTTSSCALGSCFKRSILQRPYQLSCHALLRSNAPYPVGFFNQVPWKSEYHLLTSHIRRVLFIVIGETGKSVENYVFNYAGTRSTKNVSHHATKW
uniref:Uncharacterized protein n=1 Tax=Magallana gigas TaxID=29159 RepID=K1PHS3_MAGGI